MRHSMTFKSFLDALFGDFLSSYAASKGVDVSTLHVEFAHDDEQPGEVIVAVVQGDKVLEAMASQNLLYTLARMSGIFDDIAEPEEEVPGLPPRPRWGTERFEANTRGRAASIKDAMRELREIQTKLEAAEADRDWDRVDFLGEALYDVYQKLERAEKGHAAHRRNGDEDTDYLVQGMYADGVLVRADGSDSLAEARRLADAMRRDPSFEGDTVRIITRDGELVE